MGVVLQSLMAIIVMLTCFAADSFIEEGTATFYRRPYVRECVYIYKYLYIVFWLLQYGIVPIRFLSFIFANSRAFVSGIKFKEF